MDRATALGRLRATISAGKPVIGAGAGTGISAKSAEAGGVDLIIIYNSGRYRMAGRGSLSGLLAYGFDRLPYVSSKHAVVGLSEALALYLAPKGVGLTCLCPSGVITNILEQITVYGEPTTPRAPQHPLEEPDAVGELVAEAITSGTFLVVTASEVHDELRERAADPEAYMKRMIKEQLGG